MIERPTTPRATSPPAQPLSEEIPPAVPLPPSTPTSRFEWLQPGGAFYAFVFPNYRLFFFGQLISVAGTWMQTVAEQWVVYDLTHSSIWLGIMSGATALPYVAFAFWGGEVADRLPRRTILIWTQSVAMLLALILAGLATNKVIPLQAWHIAVLAGLSGAVNAFNMPAQQAFVTEMVTDSAAMRNAIALNSLRFNLARFLGPVLAGVALVKLGAVWCFFLNGLSFIAVIVSLALMRFPKREKVVAQKTSSPWDGVHFILGIPSLLRVTMLIGVGSLFVLAVSTLYPVLATQFGRDASGFSTIVAVNGVGATVGGLTVVTLGSRLPGRYLVYGGATVFCLALLALSQMHTFLPALICLFFAGIGMVTFTTSANTKVQEDAPDELRGRVMAVYSLVANALVPVGSLLLGWLAYRLHVLPTIRYISLLTLVVTIALFIWSQLERGRATR